MSGWTQRGMMGLVGLLGLLGAPACDTPCEPDLHPAVLVRLPGYDCASLVVLLGQQDQPSLRCALLQSRSSCEAWCGRASQRGEARVRVQTMAGDEIADMSVMLTEERCPSGPGLELNLPSAALRAVTGALDQASVACVR